MVDACRGVTHIAIIMRALDAFVTSRAYSNDTQGRKMAHPSLPRVRPIAERAVVMAAAQRVGERAGSVNKGAVFHEMNVS